MYSHIPHSVCSFGYLPERGSDCRVYVGVAYVFEDMQRLGRWLNGGYANCERPALRAELGTGLGCVVDLRTSGTSENGHRFVFIMDAHREKPRIC
jgi:hypothetical protein